jgi:YVTN family beta-propeller protein
VSSERDGVISVVDPVAMHHLRDVRVGANPTSLLLDRDQRRLFVSNSSGDTISLIDTQTDKVVKTILLRPQEVRGLSGATPLGMALSPTEDRLFVALADMNAVAVIDPVKGEVAGYIPAGWYPTACAVSPDGKRLFIANAKGLAARNSNAKPGPNGQYIQDLLEGTVAMVRLPTDLEFKQMTEAVLKNNKVAEARRTDFRNPGIDHVIYIIKENRTYDQVLGDMKEGNGDPALTLFPREVTPNQHALAERFALLDNFYCCAEVSADGWNWSTSAMANEYVSRNAPYNYSGRGRVYDYEGQNNGVPVDIVGLPDVARAPGGYIWESAVRRDVSLRNFGFFTSFKNPETRTKSGPATAAVENRPNKRALEGRTDTDYRLFDLNYADSDAWTLHNFNFPGRMKAFGKFNSTSRVQEWKREYDEFVGKRSMPKFMLVRLGNDHTKGTTAGQPSPRAYAADNDYAVGQLVEHVSKSPYWNKTAIFIVEDDAQNGYDHVDAHRSTAFVISPFVRRGTIDSQFHNTATTLRTMELILGLPPLCQYDAIARPYSFFAAEPANDAPYEAILPARSIVTQINAKTAYGAKESAKLAFDKADAVPDDLLTRILWRAIKGAGTPEPPRRSGILSAAPRDDD